MKKSEQKAKLLERKLGKYKKIGNEYLFSCTNKNCASHKKNKLKLSINFDKNLYKCWVCNWCGPVAKIINRYKNDEEFINNWKSLDSSYNTNNLLDIFGKKEEIEEKIIIELPKEFVSLVDKTGRTIYKQVFEYLKIRGLDKIDLNYWKPGVCLTGEYKNRIVFPSFDENGELNYFIGRTIEDKQIPYKKSWNSYKDIIFNELYIDWEKPVILVEGVFDAIKAGDNAIPILGSTLDSSFKLFRKIVENNSIVYLALDPDADEKALKIAKLLNKYDIMVYKIDISPYKDAGEMTKQEFMVRYSKAKLLNGQLLMNNLYTILKKNEKETN